MPAKDLPVKPKEWASYYSDKDASSPHLFVNVDRKAHVNMIKTVVLLVNNKYLVFRHYGDRKSVGGELVLLDAYGKELWHKHFPSGFLSPRISNDGTVLIPGYIEGPSQKRMLAAFDPSGKKIFSFPPTARIKEFLGMEMKKTSPDHKYVAMDVRSASGNKHNFLIFLDVANNRYWETQKIYCHVHEISDQGVAKFRCPKSFQEMNKTEFFKADIKTRQFSSWQVR